jgi:hypothetical protein
MRLKFKAKIRAEWVALVAGVLAAGGIYASFIHPSVLTVAAMGDARARYEAASNDLVEARRQHQALLSNVVEQRKELAGLGGSPPSLRNKEAQLARISTIARDCQVVVDQYQPIGDLDTSEYSATYVQITTRGPFPQICCFFRRVEAEMEYVDVTHFTLTSSVNRAKPAETACLVNWSCKLSGMPRQGSEPATPGAPNKAVAAEVALHD